jgi:hypothetical protein
LNPEKALKPFDEASDIDVAIVSSSRFFQTWELIRDFQRTSWYRLNHDDRQRLRRNGENIYSGFVSPKWILDRRSMYRFDFLRLLNQLSDANVGYKTVNALYFRNRAEVEDYYRRGSMIAKRRIAR